MAFVHGKQSRLLLGVVQFDGFLNSIEAGDEIEMGDSTTFTTGGVQNEGHRFTPGLESGSLSLGGFLDNNAAAGGQHLTLQGALQADAGTVVTVAQAGLAVGSPVKVLEVRESAYPISSPVGEVVSFNASWTSEGQVDDGVSLGQTTSAVVGPTNGTAVDNAASSPTGAAANLHVTANTFTGTTTVKLQHSVDNSVWVDLITFTVVGIASLASQKAEVAGTVNRYLRMTRTSTGTGSITYAVAAARR